MKAIDLCAGLGDSAEVLGAYLPPGSEILGLEYNSIFVEYAKQRASRLQDRRRVTIQFRAQSVLETFRDVDGSAVPAESIDLVTCCGAVGVHFAPFETGVLADEIKRVLGSGGLASIDSGPLGTSRKELINIFSNRGFKYIGTTNSLVIFSIFPLVCFRKC